MKALFCPIILIALMVQTALSSVNLSFGMGTMYSGTNTGSSPFASGGLINLLAVTNGDTWATLPTTLGYSSLNDLFANTTNGFAPTGTVLVGSLANSDVGGPGITDGNFIFNYSGAFTNGVELMVVGYSTLTTNSIVPGQGTMGFFFRTNGIIDGSDIAWITPVDGTWGLGAYTLGAGGSLPNAQFTSGAGAAGGNGFTTVPEPATYALLAMSALGMGGYMIRRRRR